MSGAPGDDVLEVDVERVEQERRPPADPGRARQEPVHEPAARIDRRDVAARVHRGREGVDAVVGGHARVARREAGAVPLRLREPDVDVAVDRQRRRRRRPLERRRVALAVVDRLGLGVSRLPARRQRGRGAARRTPAPASADDREARDASDDRGARPARHQGSGLTGLSFTLTSGQVTVMSVARDGARVEVPSRCSAASRASGRSRDRAGSRRSSSDRGPRARWT